MARVINLSDKFDMAKSKIQIGEKEYEVSDSIDTMFTVQDLLGNITRENITKAIEISLGQDAVSELNVIAMNYKNLQALITAILAIITDVDYEVAAQRFQGSNKTK